MRHNPWIPAPFRMSCDMGCSAENSISGLRPKTEKNGPKLDFGLTGKSLSLSLRVFYDEMFAFMCPRKLACG